MTSTNRDIAVGSVLRVANLVATAVASFLMMPFVVRTLGDRVYGVWVLVGTFVGYYGLVDLGLSSAVSRYLAGAMGSADQEQCNCVYNTSLRLFSVLGAAVLALSAVCALLTPRFCRTPQDASLFWKLIIILGLSMAIDFPARVYTGILQACLRFSLLAILELLSLGLRTGLILTVLLTGHGVVAVALATLFSGLPAKLLSVYYAYKSSPFLHIQSGYSGMATVKSLFYYSMSSFIAQVANLLRFQIDGPVVAAFVGLSAVTHYKVAGTLAKYFMDAMAAGTQAFPSVFSRQEGAGNVEAIKRTFFFATKISTSAASFIGFGLIAWGRPFITRWMGPRYLDAYPCLVVLVVGWILSLAQAPSVHLLFATSKHKFFAWLNSAEGVANLLLSLLLVTRYGMLGVALGTMIPMVITKLIIQPIQVCRVMNFDYLEYLQSMGKSAAVISGCLLIPMLLSRLATPDYKILLLVSILSAVVYVIALWFFEFTPAETRLLGRAFWPRSAVDTVQ